MKVTPQVQEWVDENAKVIVAQIEKHFSELEEEWKEKKTEIMRYVDVSHPFCIMSGRPEEIGKPDTLPFTFWIDRDGACRALCGSVRKPQKTAIWKLVSPKFYKKLNLYWS